MPSPLLPPWWSPNRQAHDARVLPFHEGQLPPGVERLERLIAPTSSYRSAQPVPTIVIRASGRLARPWMPGVFCIGWLALVGFLLSHFDGTAFSVVALGLLSILGAALGYWIVGGLRNRATVTVSAESVELRVAPLPSSRRRVVPLDNVASVEAVTLRERRDDVVVGSAHALRFSLRTGGRFDAFASLGLSAEQVSCLATCVAERISTRIATVHEKPASAALEDLAESEATRRREVAAR